MLGGNKGFKFVISKINCTEGPFSHLAKNRKELFGQIDLSLLEQSTPKVDFSVFVLTRFIHFVTFSKGSRVSHWRKIYA